MKMNECVDEQSSVVSFRMPSIEQDALLELAACATGKSKGEFARVAVLQGMHNAIVATYGDVTGLFVAAKAAAGLQYEAEIQRIDALKAALVETAANEAR
jgi:hypothetical protein